MFPQTRQFSPHHQGTVDIVQGHCHHADEVQEAGQNLVLYSHLSPATYSQYV